MTGRTRRLLGASAAALLAFGALAAQAADAPATVEKPAAAAEADSAKASAKEVAKSTQHSVTIDGKQVAYTATAGTLTLRDDEGKAIGSMFYVAYTAGGGGKARPVTFMYNGGPGSSAIWLHMASIGPVRVETASPNPTGPAPYSLIPNGYSILDKTDLVFLDAMGTGYSRPLGEAKGKDFWGVDQDIDAFAKGIERYITLNNRWNSPKVIFGESYGTHRSAGLAYKLGEDGVNLNAVIILSSIMNYGVRDSGFDRNLINLLPTYAATAWYHDKVANKPADLSAYLQEVREFAQGPYALALAKGDLLPPAEADAIAAKVSSYTGLSVAYLKESKLRVELSRFRKEILRDEARTVGRYDSRFKGIDLDSAGENPEFDPSDTGMSGAVISSFHDYITGQLGYSSDMPYRPNYGEIGRNWDWKHRAPGSNFPSQVSNTAQDLSAAMRRNTKLKLLSLNGYFDTATPFFSTEYDVAHMQLDPSLRKNVQFRYYPSGHMVYLNVEALKTLRTDLARYYDELLK
jgi:carboxypeptidase C (cathepsin A)